MKPSDFKNKPWSSVLQKTESEIVAANIMKILARTGDTFRPLTWDEYATEREKDGDFSDGECLHFERVKGYCKSADTAILFSPAWAKHKK